MEEQQEEVVRINALFCVQAVEKNTYSEEMRAFCIYDPKDNAKSNSFSEATPYGNMVLGISNKDLKGKLQQGDYLEAVIVVKRRKQN